MPVPFWFCLVPLRLFGEPSAISCDPAPCRYGAIKVVDVYNPYPHLLRAYVTLDIQLDGGIWGPADTDALATPVSKTITWFTLPAHGRKRIRYRTTDLNPFYPPRFHAYRFALRYVLTHTGDKESQYHTRAFRID